MRPEAAGTVTVRFDFLADTLDNAMAWSRPDFLLVNGTNVFADSMWTNYPQRFYRARAQ